MPRPNIFNTALDHFFLPQGLLLLLLSYAGDSNDVQALILANDRSFNADTWRKS